MTREKAIEIIGKAPICHECDDSVFPFNCYECQEAFLTAKEALDQPVIVRCKDCRYYDSVFNGCGNITDGSPSFRLRGVKPDWFCADGRKKDD